MVTSVFNGERAAVNTFSATIIKVRNASSSNWLPCSFNKTERTDLTVLMSLSHEPPIWNGARTFRLKSIQSHSFVKRNPLTRPRSSSYKASVSTFLAPTKFVPWSERSSRTFPRLLIKRRKALMKESVYSVLRVSRWTARDARHVHVKVKP